LHEACPPDTIKAIICPENKRKRIAYAYLQRLTEVHWLVQVHWLV